MRIHRGDRPYRFDIDPEVGFWEGRWIELDGPWLRPLLAQCGLLETTHIAGCAAVGPVIEDLYERFRADGTAADHEGAALVWRVLALAERAALRDRVRADPSAQAIERVRRHIRQHLGQGLTLRDLAAVAGLSAFHFARRFKQRTGAAPMAYVRAARIARAQELLLDGVDIKRVARAVGYASAEHFSAAFSRGIGCAPGAFRSRMREG